MRISDWSSDVCSSDLRFRVGFTARDTAELRSASERLEKPDHCDRYRKPTGHANGRSKVAPSETGHGMPSPAEPGCRSEEHTSELQSLMRISYAVFCLKKTKNQQTELNYLLHIRHNTLRCNKDNIQHIQTHTVASTDIG